MQPNYNQAPQQSQVPGQPYSPYSQSQMQPPMMSYNQQKSMTPKKFALIVLLSMAFISLLGFAVWAFLERSDFKDNFDAKVEVAVNEAVSEAEARKDAEFAEEAKQPLKEYKGPDAFGGIRVKYPKTWSAYVNESGQGSTPVEAYFHPDFVPELRSGTAYALHLEVLEKDYDQVLGEYSRSSESGEVTVTPLEYEGSLAAKIDGQIERDKKGSVVLYELRDKTIKLTSESEAYLNDFNNIILENFTFNP